MKRLTVNLVVALFIVSSVQGQSNYSVLAEPVNLKINGSPNDEQIFTVGQPITVTCTLAGSASHSGAPYNKARLSLYVKVSWRGFADLYQMPEDVQEYPMIAYIERTIDFGKTYASFPQRPGLYHVTAASQASAWSKEYETDDWRLAEPEGLDAEIVTLYFQVVADEPDMTPPVITCPGDFTVYVDPGETQAVVEFEVTATDDVSDPVDIAIVCSPTSGSPFLLGETEVNCTATDEADNQATCTFRITVVESAEPPEDVVEDIIYDIELLDVPEDAEKEVEKAVEELNKAIDEFDKDKIDKALDKIAKAVKQLMKAQKDGADADDVQDVIDDLVALAEGIAEEAIYYAVNTVGADNRHVVKAWEHFDKALGNKLDGKYDKAIKEFKKAYTEAMKALG